MVFAKDSSGFCREPDELAWDVPQPRLRKRLFGDDGGSCPVSNDG